MQRIAPLIQHAQPMLNEILTKTSEINQAIGARAVQTVQTSKEYSEHLVEQLKAIAKQGNGLPAQLIEVSYCFLSLQDKGDSDDTGSSEGHGRHQGHRLPEGLVPAGQVEQGRRLCHCESTVPGQPRRKMQADSSRTRSSPLSTKSTSTSLVPR